MNFSTIEAITLHHTVIWNVENRRVLIPNSVISSETIIHSNIVDEKVCVHVEIGIGYSSNIEKAIDIIRDEAMNQSSCIDIRSEEQKENGKPPIVVRVMAWAESSINFRAWVCAVNNNEAFVLKCDLLKWIKERFE